MTSTTSSTTSIPPNGKLLSGNSPLDAAEHFETVMLSLQTSMLKDDLYYTLSEVSVKNRLTNFPQRPDGVNITEAAYLAAKKNWHTSLLKTNSDTNKAQGSFLALFHPECNAHRSLLLWFEEDVTSARRPRERKRTDYNLRNMRDKFYAEYRPDKEVNLTAIKKKWEALSDQHMSFSEFMGEWIKGVADMERIGQKPTEARQYEVLRLNVRNPNLRNIKEGLSYPVGKRMKIDDFFQVCNTYLQLNPDEDFIDYNVRRRTRWTLWWRRQRRLETSLQSRSREVDVTDVETQVTGSLTGRLAKFAAFNTVLLVGIISVTRVTMQRPVVTKGSSCSRQ